MEVIELFKDALMYPTQDWKKIIILGVLAIIASSPFVLMLFPLLLAGGSSSDIAVAISGMFVFAFIGIILLLVLWIIYEGYGLSIIRKTIAMEDDLPEFEWGTLIIDGLKVLILGILYSIIPVIISVILMIFGIGISGLALTGSDAATGASALGITGLFVFFIIFVVAIIFQLLYTIALGRLAETNSLGAAINVMDIFDKIGEIGWANYIIWIIVLIIISAILGILMYIPLVGTLLVVPFIIMFSSRALGLLYNEAKN
jgi:hypothetical protein